MQYLNAQTTTAFIEIKGKIVDDDSNDALIFADIIIKDSNISTITNSDGEFALKIPDSLADKFVTFSHLGYQKKELKISELKTNSKIKLIPAITELNLVEIKTFKDAETLLRETLKNRSNAYNDENALMTAFYRETIKKRRKNASLSEAVVQIHKQPYSNFKNDAIELIKSRKSTNYTR
ncbi:MAG TPA: carboxypeptidase-like regulatory domain-containing protein, partial [Mariniflexile sp.]